MSDADDGLDDLFARVRQEPPADLVAGILAAVQDPARQRAVVLDDMGRIARRVLPPLLALAAALLLALSLLPAASTTTQGTSGVATLAGEVTDLDAGTWFLGGGSQ